jgi:hypothetical protein
VAHQACVDHVRAAAKVALDYLRQNRMTTPRCATLSSPWP